MFFLFSFLLFLWSRRVSHSQKQPKAVLWQKIMPVLILWNRMWSFAKYSWLIRKIRSFKGNYWICFSCYRHYKIGVRITSCCSFPLLTQKSLFSYTDVCKVTQQQFRRYLGIMEKMIMVHIKSVTFHWKQVHANKRVYSISVYLHSKLMHFIIGYNLSKCFSFMDINVLHKSPTMCSTSITVREATAFNILHKTQPMNL